MMKLLFLFTGLVLLYSVTSLDVNVDNYDTLNYNTARTERARVRATGISSNEPLHIRFNAQNRFFHLLLRPISPENSPFADDLTVIEGGKNHNIQPHHFLYEGNVQGDPNSRVYGSLFDGVFDGHIHMSDGNSYTVDKVVKYTAPHERSVSFHSLIYNDDQIKNSSMKRNDLKESEDEKANTKWLQDHFGSLKLQKNGNEIAENRTVTRSKRAASSNAGRDSLGRFKVRTCSMSLQADLELYKEIFSKEGKNDATRTREEIVSIFYSHVKAANEIYSNTDFKGIKGINFDVKQIVIYTPAMCHHFPFSWRFLLSILTKEYDPFCVPHDDAYKYSENHRKKDYSKFCLSYGFTYNRFKKRIHGLASMALPNSGGGLCAEFHYRSSHNTGIVTLKGARGRIPAPSSQVTFAHEIGHSFGANHDDSWTRFLPNGPFVMCASVTSGLLPNNMKMSQKSIDSISQVLDAMLREEPVDISQDLATSWLPIWKPKRNCLYLTSLDLNVDNYDTLNYNTVRNERVRVRRASGISASGPLHIRFNAQNRFFHLVLRPISSENSPFADDLTVIEGGKNHNIQPHHFLYEGYVQGDPNSRVYGSLFDGVFDGHIHMSDGNSYTVDKVAKYTAERALSFHSVIYHDDQVAHRSEGMNDYDKANTKDHFGSSKLQESDTGNSKALRSKRAVSSNDDKDSFGWFKVRTCSMSLQADLELYKEIFSKEGKNDSTRTREEIVSIFYSHVRAANKIYSNTDFKGIKGINFDVKQIVIYTPGMCHHLPFSLQFLQSILTKDYDPFCGANDDGYKYLHDLSKKDHSKFCLAYGMTYNAFKEQLHGLAHLALPNSDGGLCSEFKYRSSLNIGMMTLNGGARDRIPSRASQLTFAHEIGHSLGAEHDDSWTNFLLGGSFLMNPITNSGLLRNHNKLSQKSIDSISKVLDAMLRQEPVDISNDQAPFQLKRNCLYCELIV